MIQLVCEDVSRAHGRSLPYEGNACAYRVEFIDDKDGHFPPGTVVLGREADETEDEGEDAAGAASQQPNTQEDA